jgi:group I intron endonuclease
MRFKSRYKGHLSALIKQRHQNLFLQRDFNDSGQEHFIFEMVELVEGTKQERMDAEQKYIDLYWDNCVNCYNIRKKAYSSEGKKHPNKEKQKRIFKENCQTPKVKAAQIAACSKYFGKIISPIGEVFEVFNLEKFEREHDVCNLDRVYSGEYKQMKGWRLYSPELVGTVYVSEKKKITNFRLLSPNGEIFEGTSVVDFAKEHNISRQSLQKVLTGKTSSCEGWRDADNPRFEKKK